MGVRIVGLKHTDNEARYFFTNMFGFEFTNPVGVGWKRGDYFAHPKTYGFEVFRVRWGTYDQPHSRSIFTLLMSKGHHPR